jgi:hypothetical protein
MNFWGPLGSLLAALFFGWAGADFTSSFDTITAGSAASLTWDAVPPGDYPLCIRAQLIDKSADGLKANAYLANITSTPTDPLGGMP